MSDSPTDPKAPTTDKAHVGNVTLAIGMLSTVGNLHTTKRVLKDDTHLTCPVHDGPTEFLKQRYLCNEDPTHGPFTTSEAARGRLVGDKIVTLDAAEVAKARKSVLPEKELNLQVHSREEVEKFTFPAGNAYVFVPKGNPAFASVLIELLKKRPDIALIAKTNLRGHDHIVQLDVELDDQLIVREMVWPEEMKSFAPNDLDAPERKLVAQAEMLLDASIEPFVADDYKKDSMARTEQIFEEAAGGKTTAKKKPSPKKVNADNLEAMIQAAIAAKKAS